MTASRSPSNPFAGRRSWVRSPRDAEGPRPAPRAFADALASADEATRLMAYGLDWLARSVPAPVIVFSPVDRQLHLFRQGPLIVKREGRAGSGSLERMLHEYLTRGRRVDPFAPSCWLHSANTVITLRDVGGPERFARSAYREFLGAYGMASQTTIFLRDRGRIIAAILLLRRLDQPNLTLDDVRLLRGTQPLLEQSLTLALGLPLPPPDDVLATAGLTARECEVARLAAGGATNAEIAVALFLSLATVKTHMSRVLTKTGARSRSELVALVRAGAAPRIVQRTAASPITVSN